MKAALLEAKAAAKEGEVPVGAVVSQNGKIIARGHNHREGKHDVSSHAEIEALRAMGSLLGRYEGSDCTLYVTLEPCLMCAGAILQARIKRLVFALTDVEEGAIVSRYHVFDEKLASAPLVKGGILAEESSKLLKGFFKAQRVFNKNEPK